MDKYIGRLLDNRYEILEIIGTGGMAVVYKARCHRLNRLVAIKILKDDYLEDEEFRRRFHSESQAVAMLSHPNIVSVYDVSTSITADYIVMELIDGITLKQYMEKKGVLNWKETLHFAIQIAKALEHAHSRGIVHRDIKPHNVMVLKNGSVKVTDFGIARMMSKGNTLTKEALGSVHYISPEQAKGGRVDNRSDIYSLGVVMYEMMSGRPPYDGESPVAVAIQHINGGAKMPSTLNPNIPGGLEQIIMKAMALEPDGRYETATAMLTDLDEFRKNPATLFDYNTPPTDAVINIPKAPLVLNPEPPKTTAEKAEQRSEGSSAAAAAAARRRRAADRQRAAQRRREAEEEQKSNKVATIAIIACSVVMLIAVVIFIVALGRSGIENQEVIVPELTGKNFEEIKDSAEYADFIIKLKDEVYSDEHPAGTIMDQTPKANTKVAKQTKIYVTVSIGPQQEPIYMPELKDREKNEAETILKDLKLDLEVKFEEAHSDTVKEGYVVTTSPGVGQELQKKQTVTVYISLGKEIKQKEMPNLVSEEDPIDFDKAEELLEALEMDLRIEPMEEHSSTVESGYVIRTEPEAGQELQTGQTVKIYISKGAKLEKLQDVTSLSVADAIATLKELGFANCEIRPVPSNAGIGTILNQYALVGEEKILPGNEVDVNALIILEVPEKKVKKTVTIDIPTAAQLGNMGFTELDYTVEGAVNFTITMKNGGELIGEWKNINFSSNPIQVQVEDSGTQSYTISVNGRDIRRIDVDFTA